MANPLKNDLESLVKEGVITTDIADRIRQWYARKNASNPNRLILVFGVLGVLLVGTGIILLVAHNWDDMSIPVKTFFAFLPLLIGQVWAGYTLLKNKESEMHGEMSAGWLTLAIGASISLVSQVYHLPGSIPTFLLTWLVLGLPVIYLLRSSVASLLFIAGATWYGVEVGYAYHEYEQNGWAYFLLMLAVLPHYYFLFRSRASGWFAVLHHFVIPVSLLICLGIVGDKNGEKWMWVAYMSMLGIFYLAGQYLTSKNLTGISNAYRIIGWTGSLVLLFIGSFNEFWSEVHWDKKYDRLDMGSLPFLVAMSFTIGAVEIMRRLYQRKLLSITDPIVFAFLVYAPLFFAGIWAPDLVTILVNLYLLAIGVWLLIRGQQQERLALLNLGLGVIAVLAVCRFFDTDLSFIVRGIMFIVVGGGFVYFNYQLIQKKKKI